MCSTASDVAVQAIEDALDTLAAADLDACSDADLLDRTRELVAVANRVAADDNSIALLRLPPVTVARRAAAVEEEEIA